MARQDRRCVFTDRWVRTVEPESAGRDEWTDAKQGGLKLRVWRDPRGQVKRSFSVTYKLLEKRRRDVIGQNVTSAEARKRAKEILAKVEVGEDPRRERREAREALKRVEQTVGGLFDQWLAADAEKSPAERWKPRTLKQWASMAETIWKPLVGDWPVRDKAIDRELEFADEVEAYLRGVAKKQPVRTNRRYEMLRTCLRWARARRTIRHNPLEGMTKPGGREKTRAVTFTDDQLRVIDGVSGEEGWQGLFRLAAYTGVRLAEGLEASWTEMDLDRRVWEISPERTKIGDPHLVPLSDGASRVVRSIREANLAAGWGGEPLLFPAKGRGERQGEVVPAAQPKYGGVKAALNLEGLAMVMHDVRRTVRSRLPGLRDSRGARITPDVAERVLGHRIGGIRSVYDHADYLPHMREALDAWGRELDGILKVAKERGRA